MFGGLVAWAASPTVTFHRDGLEWYAQFDDDSEDNAVGYVGRAALVARRLRKDGYEGLAARLRDAAADNPTAFVAYLGGIEVAEQGQGRGGALLSATLVELRRVGAHYVYLHASASSGRAIDLDRFYQARGFTRLVCCASDIYPVFVRQL